MEEKYKKMFSRVKASPEKIQEVIDMTETRKPRRIVRNLLVTAAIMALAVLTAMGANAASGGELFAQIISYVEYTTEDGEHVAEMQVEINDDVLGAGGIGEFEVIQDENGKAILVYTDENGQKVTKEIDLEDEHGAAASVAEQIQGQYEAEDK